jgi:SLBB domain
LPIFEIMRAYRLCAAISRAWSRSSAQLRSRVTTLALLASLCVPPAVLADSGSLATATGNAAATLDSRSRSSLAYYGILGEVARPGVYQLSTGCTLGQLVSGAGGLTGNANGNARVLRGARLAEQFFVAASESAVLSPGDLIVVGAQSSRLAEPNGAPAGRAPTQVQIGLLNLISRPVVLTLSRERASPARIMEFLGQPPALADDLGIVGPSRADVRASFSANFADDRLASGAVLIFPPHRVRAASLPTLPEPIVLAPPQPEATAAPSAPAVPPTETAHGADAPPTSSEASRYRGGRVAGFYFARGAQCRIAPPPPANVDAPSPQQLERMILGAAALRGAQMAGSPVRNVSRQEWDREERLSAERARSRPYIFFFVIAGTATLAIAFTIGSMSLRGLRSIRSRRRATVAGLVPPVPTFAELTPGTRILRVDVNQPQTRLALDLAVFEQAQARRAQRATSLPDHTPKAA